MLRNARWLAIALISGLLLVGIAPGRAYAGDATDAAHYERADDLGISRADAAVILTRMKQGILPQSATKAKPIRSTVERADFQVISRYYYPDQSVTETRAPDIPAILFATSESKDATGGAGSAAAKAAGMSGCKVTPSGSITILTNCKVTGSNINVSMAYRLNYQIGPTGLPKLNSAWDEQVSSPTGSISGIGFAYPSSTSVSYKANWTFYAGAPSQIYTLATNLTNWGGANVQLY